MIQTHFTRPRRRRWPAFLIILLVVLAGLWAGGWYYGAGVAEQTIDGWKAQRRRRDDSNGCTDQTIGGFPFGIEVHCADASAEFKSNNPPIALKSKGMLVTASVWQPTVLTTEFAGPLTVAKSGRPVAATATWQHAQSQVRGLPPRRKVSRSMSTIRWLFAPRAISCSQQTASPSMAVWCPALSRTIP